MSLQRRIFTALAVFAVAAGLLAVAEAKKPAKVASLERPTAQQPSSGAANSGSKEAKKPPRAKKYLPVADFGDY